MVHPLVNQSEMKSSSLTAIPSKEKSRPLIVIPIKAKSCPLIVIPSEVRNLNRRQDKISSFGRNHKAGLLGDGNGECRAARKEKLSPPVIPNEVRNLWRRQKKDFSLRSK